MQGKTALRFAGWRNRERDAGKLRRRGWSLLMRVLVGPLAVVTAARATCSGTDHGGGARFPEGKKTSRRAWRFRRRIRTVFASFRSVAPVAHPGSAQEKTSLRDRARSPSPAAALLIWFLAGVLAVSVGARLWTSAVSPEALPRWDAARYGAAGARLAHDVRHLDALDFAKAVAGLDLWGPVFPVIEAAAFVPLGSSYRTASGLMVVLFVLTVVAGYWAGRQLDGAGAHLAGAFVAVSVALSPAFQQFGTLPMLEVPGALLLFLAVGSYLRALRTGTPQAFTTACVAAVLLFFLKFNYGLAWLVPLAVTEAWLAAGSLAALFTRVVSGLKAADWRSPWRIFLLAYGAAILALAIFGGWRTDSSGETTRAISLGTPLYALYIVVLARGLLRPRRSWTRFKAWYASARPRWRAVVLVMVAPIAVWMLAPSHARGFIRVLENRRAGPSFWTREGILFYPHAFLYDFSPAVVVGAASLALVAFGILLWRRFPLPHRVVLGAFVLGVLGTVAHPYKLPRFLFPLVPLLWLTAGGTLAAAIVWLARTRLRLLVLSAAAAVILVVGIRVPIDRERLASFRGAAVVPATVRTAAAAVVTAAVRVHRSVLVGYWNEFSPGLVEWEGWQTVPWFEAGDVPLPAGHVLRDAVPDRLADVAARHHEFGGILVLDLDPGGAAWSPGWARENAWLEPARRAVEEDPRWRMTAEHVFRVSGYRLQVYERANGMPPHR
jgi:hypothetical protein